METSLTGKLLIAMPGIGDSRFERAVIFMCQHSHDAAMGLIVNKIKPEIRLGDVLEHLGIEVDEDTANRAVMDGGPVKQDRGYVLHSEEFEAKDATQSIVAGVRLTATRDVLEAMASPATSPRRFMLALGHSSWGPGQLENEILRNAWLVADLDRAILFDDEQDSKWDRAVRHIGVEPWMITSEGGRA